ncbi:MAG: hypothetical protein LQ337_001296 [Flavoplaca oasis]|nr:MAG: hypothetical protein LQ337_001296 [Flavoplaca oasis]
MSKKQFKYQASSSRAASGLFTAADGAFGSSTQGGGMFGAVSSSPLSYVYEPPDLTSISEPNTVVAFKNLQKKDSTTKAKALEDLLKSVSSGKSFEDAALDAWIKVYPRTSIDSARRVRQLAHQLQGLIAHTSGKRFVKHMPDVVGAWLAGLFDSDKMVSRAAQESFKQTFQTDEKMQSVWKIYLGPILQFCSDAVFKENIQTLSDERTVSPDEASAKHARVVAAALSAVQYVLENNSREALIKYNPALDEFVNSTELWKLTSNPDASVRKAIYRLLDVCLAKRPDVLNLEMISTFILVSGLSVNQTASSLDYARTIARLTEYNPKIWTEFYTGTGKKSANKRLCHFLSKGSQGASSQYWDKVKSLLLHVPISVLIPQESVSDQKFAIIEAIRDGVSNRDEPRLNQRNAWNTYLEVAERLLSCHDVDRDRLIEDSVMPILMQYVSPSQELAVWTVSGSPLSILRDVTNLCLKSPTTFLERWTTLSKLFVEEVQTSLPEQAKDFARSQDMITAKASRWYGLQSAMSTVGLSERIRVMLTDRSASEIVSAIELLKARKGKPYGAASLISTAFRLMPNLLSTQQQVDHAVAQFVLFDVPDLLLSPSSPYLIELIPLLGNIMDINDVSRKSLQSVLDSPQSLARSKALQHLVGSSLLAHVSQDEKLLTKLTSALKQEMDDKVKQGDLLSTTVANPNTPAKVSQALITDIVANLSLEDDNHSAGLQALQTVVKFNPTALKNYDSSTEGSPLLAKLISLGDSPDAAVSRQAKTISDAFRADASIESNQGKDAVLNILRRGPETISAQALSIPSLIDLARTTLQGCNEQHRSTLVAELIPDEARWRVAIQPFFTSSPNPSLAVMNPLSNAISLIESTRPCQAVQFDKYGYSAAFRLFWYTSALIQTSDVFEYATVKHQASVAKYLALILQIANDHLSISSSHPLWQLQDPEHEVDIVEIVSQTQRLTASWLTDISPELLLRISLSELLEDAHGISVRSYYSSRAYISTMTELAELHTAADLHLDTDKLSSARKAGDTFAAAAAVSAVQTSAALTRIFNELLAQLTGDDLKKYSKSMMDLIILNNILNREDFEDSLPSIPRQRLVFFVQHLCGNLVKVFDAADAPGLQARRSTSTLIVNAEMMRALSHILPSLSETYGTFWESIIQVLTKAWTIFGAAFDDRLPLIHASLRLFSTLRKLGLREPNDDLVDALQNHQGSIASSMLSLLQSFRNIPDESHQPRKIVNQMLARQISYANIEIQPSTVSELFPVLGSESLALQDSAYSLLHRQIPKSQEHVALDKALSKDYVAKLPEELLSLILEAPTQNALSDVDFKRSMPPSLRSYLLSWHLVFDHWTGASDAVKNDYINAIKEGSYIQSLLHLASDFLITSRIRPVDANKFGIDSYTPGSEETPEKDTHSMLINLYFLALKHLPTLSKAWWRDNTSRQTQVSVESWTERYISPLIISSELATVSAWGPSQASDPDQTLTIKVSTSTREVTASIPIDEQFMSLAIVLPPSYPLSRATVSGLHRVGVTEQKWRSWIITTQGVINFSDIGGGNQLIDGLMAWRKNVTATLKGQTECAICYSVVSADRQLPNKRCGTCKNMFHGSCLFKWFKSSNSSSCPLCRNQFSYA